MLISIQWSSKSLIKYDIQEPEEQTIVTYFRGLDPTYANGIEYNNTTFDELCVLGHKVEQQKKAKPYRREFPRPSPRNHPLTKGVLLLLRHLNPWLNLSKPHKEPQLLKKPFPLKIDPIGLSNFQFGPKIDRRPAWTGPVQIGSDHFYWGFGPVLGLDRSSV